jgi:hypothetical protein
MASLIIQDLFRPTFAVAGQWEGTTVGGDHVYIRYEAGRLRVGVGPELRDAIRARWTADTPGRIALDMLQHELEDLIGCDLDEHELTADQLRAILIRSGTAVFDNRRTPRRGHLAPVRVRQTAKL